MRLRAVLAMVLAVGCGGSEEQLVEEWTRLEEQRVCERFTLTLSSRDGDCLGGCTRRVHLASNSFGYVGLAGSPERPEAEFLLVATPEEMDAVKGALAEALTQKWEDEYRCRYCADGGRGEWTSLQYTCDGTQFLQTTIDPGAVPQFLEPVLARLWELQSAHTP